MAPFGGYKQSGNGREWGEYGMEEFLEINIPGLSKPSILQQNIKILIGL